MKPGHFFTVLGLFVAVMSSAAVGYWMGKDMGNVAGFCCLTVFSIAVSLLGLSSI